MRLRKQILLCFKAPQSSRSFDKRKIIDLYFIRMKYVIVLGDGMADEYIPSISGTPLEKANIENARKLAKTAKIGLVKTVPDGFKPASDVANLAVLGYAPEKYYSGRSPLEALSIGVDMKDTDVAYRMNLVTLSTEQNFSDKTMVDYSAGEISTAEAAVLVAHIKKHLETDSLHFYPGVSYRHCLIINHGVVDDEVTPPHDITGRKIKDYLPKGVYKDLFLDLYEKSYALLENHPINEKRKKEGKNPANCIWFWGGGVKPALTQFVDKTSLRGAMISAVDLLKGIGKGAGMDVIEVNGATGNWDTNFSGKGEAALKALETNDFCYIHVEAPDECGHRGDAERKVYSIEMIDKDIIGTIVNGLTAKHEDFALMFLPDHPTPCSIKTHSRNPVPFLMYSSREKLGENNDFNEKTANDTGVFYADAPSLFNDFIKLK